MRTPDDYQQLIARRVSERAAQLGRLVDYIEVGVLTGNSAEAVLSTNKVRYAVLIDNFSNTYCGDWKSTKEQVEKRLDPYSGLFDVRQGSSRDILPTLIEEFDVGFVDGDHSERMCWLDMEEMLPLMRKDGIMFVDDLGPAGNNLFETVKRFAAEHQLNFTYHHVHNLLGELWRN